MQFKDKKEIPEENKQKMLNDHLQILITKVRALNEGNSFISSFRSTQNHIDEQIRNGDINVVQYPIGLPPVIRSMLITIRLETFQ